MPTESVRPDGASGVTATAAGTFAPTHAILCRCADCLADGYGYTPSIEPDPSLIEDGAA